MILPAVVSAAVALGGSYVTWRLEIGRWEKEVAYSSRKELFAKRTELVERTVSLFSRIPNAGALKADVDYAIAEGIRTSPSKRPAPEAASAALEKVRAMQEMQADVAAVLSLDIIYFGPKTEAAVRVVNAKLGSAKPWWSVPQSELQVVVDAMRDELFADPGWPAKRAAP